jgi:hypothetical protein
MIKLKYIYEKHELDSTGSGKDLMLSYCNTVMNFFSSIKEMKLLAEPSPVYLRLCSMEFFSCLVG